MYELKKIGKVFTSKFVGPGRGPRLIKKRIYWAAVSQRLTNTALVTRGLKLLHRPCRHAGWMELWLWALTAAEWSASCLSCCTHSSLWVGWCLGLGTGLDILEVKKCLVPAKIQIMPVAWSLYWVCCTSCWLGAEATLLDWFLSISQTTCCRE
jgi:hypothetical protein